MKADKDDKSKGPATKTKRDKSTVAKPHALSPKSVSKPGPARAAGKKPARKSAAKPVRTRGRRRPSVATETVEAIFRRFAEIEPEPKGELEHKDAYTLLVAVVLSAQATDAGVNKATRHLFALADTPEKMVALGEDKVRDLIKTIGLFRNKAKNVVALSQKLIADYGGEVPDDRAALESLPGVGRKTANVVLNVWFGQPSMAVDTHVFRIAHRLGFSNGSTPEEVERDLMAIVPDEYGVPAHHWLILHGRYLCKARKPECWRCPIRDYCPMEDKTPPPRK
ncbi:MAG: endonuclease III [Alphaproteobacteria bacterium]|nr:endonuclease III [Alphaproteobacteria bacterium]